MLSAVCSIEFGLKLIGAAVPLRVPIEQAKLCETHYLTFDRHKTIIVMTWLFLFTYNESQFASDALHPYRTGEITWCVQ